MNNNFNQNNPNGDSYYRGYGYGYEGFSEGASQSRSLSDYILILRERIWWLVVSAFVVFMGVALYTLNAPRSYRAVSSVEILRQKDKVFQIEEIVRTEVLNAEDFNTQIKILESASIIQAVDERLVGNMRQRFLAPYEKGLDATLRGTKNVARFCLPTAPLCRSGCHSWSISFTTTRMRK